MKNLFPLITLSLLALFLASCKSMPAQTTDVVNLYSKNGSLVTSIQEPETVARIKNAVENSQKTYVKILPIYKYYIELTIGGKKQQWLVSTLGYIERKDSDSYQLYKISNPEILAKYLQ